MKKMQLEVDESTPASDMTIDFNPELQLAIAASFANFNLTMIYFLSIVMAYLIPQGTLCKI